MNAFGKSSVVFVTLSGLFWGGWMLGSQTPEGQEALARAYEAYAEQQAEASAQLFDTTALRAIVCGEAAAERPCIAVAAAGRLFIVDAGTGAAAALNQHDVPMDRLAAVLLTEAGLPQTTDLGALFLQRTGGSQDGLLPVYGPGQTQRLVDGLNNANGLDGAQRGLQAWGPSPEPGQSVIVFEADGLVVSAFAAADSTFNNPRVGYRFDYHGRSIVVGGDGEVAGETAAHNADVVLQGAQHGGAATVATQAFGNEADFVVFTDANNQVVGQRQEAEARAAGFGDVAAARPGMLLELPLENSEIAVRLL